MSGWRQRQAAAYRSIDVAVRQCERLEADERATAKAKAEEARERERVRPKLTASEVRGAQFVRDRHGWHRVVRVSVKSVTVETDHSWTDRIPLDRVLEVRTVGTAT